MDRFTDAVWKTLVTALHQSKPGAQAAEVGTAIERCRAEIAAIEVLVLAGHPDVEGLCMALSDWWGELRMIEQEMGLPATEAAATAKWRANGIEGAVACRLYNVR